MANAAKTKAVKKTAVASVEANTPSAQVPTAEQAKAISQSAQDLFDGKPTVMHVVGKAKGQKGKNMFDGADSHPAHFVKLVTIIKMNADIRRHVSLAIINYLNQRKEINGKGYVIFKWNKFSIKSGSLTKEYSYKEVFFLNALAASFASFSADAQVTIDSFIEKESISVADA